MTTPQQSDIKGVDNGGERQRNSITESHGGRGSVSVTMEPRHNKLGSISGVYIPVFLNIMSILMFLRFGQIIGKIGFVGILGLLVTAYSIDLLTTLSLSAIASNGEVKGGGAYYLISRSLGPEFGGSIGILFYLAQVLNASMNVVGLIDCVRLNLGAAFPSGYWTGYGLQTAALLLCTGLCFLGSATFSRASNALLAILSLAIVSIPVSAVFKAPFHDRDLGIHFTGPSLDTLTDNFLPHSGPQFKGLETFRDLFGILFPATSGIFAGASMSGDLKDPSRSIPHGTLWAMLTTFIIYFVVILSLAASTTHSSFLANDNVIPLVNLSQPVILAGECAVTFFSALMGLIGASKLFQAFARDKLLPGLGFFSKGTKHGDEPIYALLLTYVIAQLALFADLNQIATFISMGYQMTFFVMNLACFLLKVGSAPNFRPSFKFFTWQTAFLAGILSGFAMFFIDETYAAIAITVLVLLFLLIHYLSPPKHWGDVSQNLIYHQVRKYLLRLRPEHIKFWRPHIILLINNPRRQTRLIQFCNSLKKGSLYILGHVIVTDDFNSGVHEARLQQHAWTKYINEFSKIKAFVQLTMSPTITWGIRNLILSAGLGGMRPNIAVLGFYNMEELRKSNPKLRVPDVPVSLSSQMRRPPRSNGKAPERPRRRRGDTSARLMEGILPTDVIRTENMMSPKEYLTILEDLALRYRLNIAVGCGFESLETPRKDGTNTKKYIDLWPIQMSAEVTSDGKSLLTTNFDTYTLILQLGHILHSVQLWKHVYTLRVMVFVEYESEVNEEHARVLALLEKLRIDAEVKVFCLASGSLNTYDLIVNGIGNDIDWEIVVNDTLRNEEWWDDVQMFRGRSDNMTSTQELDQLEHIYDTISGRPGLYNPHEEIYDRRRASTTDVPELPRRPAIRMLSKMGVSMGIHTHHLPDGALDETDNEDDEAEDSQAELLDDEEMGYSSTLDHESIDERNIGPSDAARQPLLGGGDSHDEDGRVRGDFWESFGRRSKSDIVGDAVGTSTSYGTMSSSATVKGVGIGVGGVQTSQSASASASQVAPESSATQTNERPHGGSTDSAPAEFPPLVSRDSLGPSAAFSRVRPPSPTREDTVRPYRSGASTPGRPNLSRQSSAVKFSSRPVPETKIVASEAEGSTISFAPPSSTESETPKAGPYRPSYSRQSSLGKFPNRSRPSGQVLAGEESRKVSFAEQSDCEPYSTHHSRFHSRRNSRGSTQGGGESYDQIPEMLERYRLSSHLEEEGQNSGYTPQGLELSFNELPSRAQHLIVNELMRQHSKETAVLLSTLPIPSEGTCLDEASTVQYLSDVEVLCNELPPTLLVLSNNMTVTVNL
ncbi:Vacuolar cation-chloride cotransporter 1 [Fusarium oxysporum f. sp. matthiolae]|nr:Vacuolar cation-chloride cotransporter 1 [Fusarium oxysporum f. sp. matthiolae]